MDRRVSGPRVGDGGSSLGTLRYKKRGDANYISK